MGWRQAVDNLQPQEQGSRERQKPQGLAPSLGVCRCPLAMNWGCTYPKEGLSPWAPMTLESGDPSPPSAWCRPTFPGQSWTAWPHEPTQARDALPQHQSCVPAGRKPKGKPFLTLKTPEDTEISCHHTKPIGRQQTPHPQSVLENHSGISKEVDKHAYAAQDSPHHETSSTQVWLTFCQKAGQALNYNKLNEISFLVLLSFFNWPMLNYLKPSFINLLRLFFHFTSSKSLNHSAWIALASSPRDDAGGHERDKPLLHYCFCSVSEASRPKWSAGYLEHGIYLHA